MSWDDDDRAPLQTLARNYYPPLKTHPSGILGDQLLKKLAKVGQVDDNLEYVEAAVNKAEVKAAAAKAATKADDIVPEVYECDEEDIVTPGNTQTEEEYNADILDNMIYEKMW